jgi:hypothetical protein
VIGEVMPGRGRPKISRPLETELALERVNVDDADCRTCPNCHIPLENAGYLNHTRNCEPVLNIHSSEDLTDSDTSTEPEIYYADNKHQRVASPNSSKKTDGSCNDFPLEDESPSKDDPIIRENNRKYRTAFMLGADGQSDSSSSTDSSDSSEDSSYRAAFNIQRDHHDYHYNTNSYDDLPKNDKESIGAPTGRFNLPQNIPAPSVQPVQPTTEHLAYEPCIAKPNV